MSLLLLQANPPADPNRFDEAIDWHRKRTGITKDEYNALSEAARRRAFTIAGVTQASLIREIQDSLTQALENGQSLDDWKATALPKLTKAWAGTVSNPSARADTIFRTNVQHAYSAGRHAQLTDPVTRKIRPFWLYDSVIDGRTTTGCRARNGTLLHQDDPWWNNNYPPTHFNCRAIARSLRRSEAEARGITDEPPPGIVAPGFGGLPAANDPETDPLAAQVQRNANAGLPPPPPPTPVVELVEPLPIPERTGPPPRPPTPEANKAAKAASDAVRAAALPVEIAAVKAFTGHMYAVLRSAERNGEIALVPKGMTESDVRAQAATLSAFLERATPLPCTVYRGLYGLSDEALAKLASSPTIDIDAFSSTSRSYQIANRFALSTDDPAHAAVIVLRQRSGVPIETMSKNKTEKEVLLRRGTKYRVVSRYYSGGILHIEAEEQ